MGPWLARLRSGWRALWHARDLDRSMDDEMRFHLDMEAERLARERGLGAVEAHRQACVAFGGVEKYKEQGRDTRGLRWLDMVSLDARLGVRMLFKYRGLTLVGGCAMAVAIAVGATSYQAFSEVLDPALPFDEGEHIAAVRYATPTPGGSERRVLREFVEWRDEIRSIEDLGAFRTAQHNLVWDGSTEPARVAEITASAFAVTRTPPLLGRYLVADDERHSAPPVVVIGHRVWQSRFGGDANIVGRSTTLGGTPSTIVGVMPDGFRFPIDHEFWTPLRVDPLRYERLQGPRLFVFGRLARAVTLEEAQAELTAVGQRTASAHPDTHARLRPAVLPYTHEHMNITDPFRLWLLRIAQLLVGALSFVVAVNLAILVYARTVARLGEIAVRTALGASRRRILVQLFIEALALAAVGAAGGLALAHVALTRLQELALKNGGLPFWIDLALSPGAVVFGIGLSVLAAVVMGVLPGLKATSGQVHANLRDLDGRTGGKLGPVWTVLVVAQVAVAVAVLPIAVHLTWQVTRMGFPGSEVAADRLVVGLVAIGDDAAATDSERIAARQLELTTRLESEPGVSAVAFSSGVPGFSPGKLLRFDAASSGVRHPGSDLGVDVLDVSPDLFDAHDASILAGRPLTIADRSTRAVVVNRAFMFSFLVDTAAPDAALGVRFSYVAPYERPGTRPDTSYEVVGVVRDFPSFPPAPGSDGSPTVYHPAAPGEVHPFVLSVRFSGGIPPGFTDRFRALAAEVDPTLQVRRVVPLSNYYDDLRAFWRYLATGVGLLTLSVLLLSAAGMYAMMAFTVTQRTREIAIRAALGAAPHRLIAGIFGRAIRQLTLGVAAGSLLAALVFYNVDVEPGRAAALVLCVGAMMTLVGLVAASGPARRGLRIQAGDALRTDG